MLNTDKSIKKNFKKCCLKEGEELVYQFLCKSGSLKKKFILAHTNQNRFLMGSAKTFGKMVLLDEFVASDVKSIEMGVKTGMTLKYFTKIDFKGKKDVFTFIMKVEPKNILSALTLPDPSPSNILKQIYEQVPSSKPSYLKDSIYLDALAVKQNMIFLFSSQKLLILDFDGTNVSVKEEIDYSKITDFDVYHQKAGNYMSFYLEIDSKPELYLTSSSDINNLSSVFSHTNIPKPVPAYMENDEKEIVTFNISKKSMGAGLGKRKMRVASKNVFLLEKHKDGKLVPYEKIPISNISSIKADTLGTMLKAGNSKKHEIIIKTKDGKKTKVWISNVEVPDANAAIDYISQNIR